MTKKRPTHFLILNNDIPSLGTGWRGVILKKLGRKWAHFSAAADGSNYKVPVAKWEALSAASARRLARGGLNVEYKARSTRFARI